MRGLYSYGWRGCSMRGLYSYGRARVLHARARPAAADLWRALPRLRFQARIHACMQHTRGHACMQHTRVHARTRPCKMRAACVRYATDMAARPCNCTSPSVTIDYCHEVNARTHARTSTSQRYTCVARTQLAKLRATLDELSSRHHVTLEPVYSHGPFYLWPYIVMASSRHHVTLAPVYSHGLSYLWPYIVMASSRHHVTLEPVHCSTTLVRCLCV